MNVDDQVTRQKIQDELLRAEQAQREGNDGLARVCARRAAGIAVRDYLNQRGISFSDPSAIAVLGLVESLGQLPEDIKRSAAHLLTRVDTNYRLPDNVDLVEQAKRLISALEQHLRGDDLER